MYTAAVNCSEGNVRLQFGANERIGRVEVCVSGFWSSICNNLWDSRDADVVCRQLGFPTFGKLFTNGFLGDYIIHHDFVGTIPYLNNYFNGPVLLDRVSCDGDEATILECTHSGIGVVSSWCNQYNHAGVQCLGNICAHTTQVWIHTLLTCITL